MSDEQKFQKRLDQVTKCMAAYKSSESQATENSIASVEKSNVEKLQEQNLSAVQKSVDIESILNDFNETSAKLQQMTKKKNDLLEKLVRIRESDIVTQEARVATTERAFKQQKELLQKLKEELARYNALRPSVRVLKGVLEFL